MGSNFKKSFARTTPKKSFVNVVRSSLWLEIRFSFTSNIRPIIKKNGVINSSLISSLKSSSKSKYVLEVHRSPKSVLRWLPKSRSMKPAAPDVVFAASFNKRHSNSNQPLPSSGPTPSQPLVQGLVPSSQ